MSYQREKWQAHMNRVGASALREETLEDDVPQVRDADGHPPTMNTP